MTTRKPPRISVPDWIERQIRDAQAAGAFDDLPGKGKPIADLDRPQHEQTWVAGYLRRENVDVASLLPPALALAKEAEELPGRLVTIRSESEARQMIDDLNARIRRAHAAPVVGPPVRVKLVDTEAAIEERRRRVQPAAPASSDASYGPDRPDDPPPGPTRRRRSWWRRPRGTSRVAD